MHMVRIQLLLTVCLSLICNSALANVTRLEFDTPSPGTLADSNGQGTGFTVRFPGSGASIPANDPNLTLDTLNGHLLIHSTRSDFNQTGFGRNLAGMEAPAILILGAGNDNFVVRAKYLDIHVDQLSDQLGIFVGRSVDNVVRAGAHETMTPGTYQAIFNWSQNGVDGLPNGGALNAFNAGDDAVFQLGRIGGQWHFRWQNLNTPALSGSVENFTIPGLDSEADLYFGVFNHDARNTTPQLATLEYFEVLTGASVPEPTSIGLAILAFLLFSTRRWP
jgi:hypothetical protein